MSNASISPSAIPFTHSPLGAPVDTVRGILHARAARSGEDLVDRPNVSMDVRLGKGLKDWLSAHRKSLAFSAGLGVVLLAIALLSLAGSGAKASSTTGQAPAEPSAVSYPHSSSASPEAPEVLGQAPINAEANGVTPADSLAFVEGVALGTKRDTFSSRLISDLACQKSCDVLAREISKNGDVSVVVVAAITADGAVRERSVIVEKSGDVFRIRQIIQPATPSATG